MLWHCKERQKETRGEKDGLSTYCMYVLPITSKIIISNHSITTHCHRHSGVSWHILFYQSTVNVRRAWSNITHVIYDTATMGSWTCLAMEKKLTVVQLLIAKLIVYTFFHSLWQSEDRHKEVCALLKMRQMALLDVFTVNNLPAPPYTKTKLITVLMVSTWHLLSFDAWLHFN